MGRERIGPKIKRLRQQRQLTQQELANSLGYADKSMIAHIEKGDSDMTYEKILLLLRSYCLDANELFDVSEIDKRLSEVRESRKNAVYASVADYYGQYDEDERLKRRYGQVEWITTNKYIHNYLKPGDKIIEIGAGTGAYSIPLSKEGYDVTSVELVERNLEILKSKITADMKINACQGNALDLSRFDDESFDVALVLGPMYHLFTTEDKVKCLLEAKRITKKGGRIFVAYCLTDGSIITSLFVGGDLEDTKNRGMITEDWRLKSDPKEIFDLVRVDNIDEYNKGADLRRIKIVATDGASYYIRDYLSKVDEGTFQQWMDYHLHTCERADLLGGSHHCLDILIK